MEYFELEIEEIQINMWHAFVKSAGIVFDFTKADKIRENSLHVSKYY